MARLTLLALMAVLVGVACAEPQRATAVAFLRETNPTQNLIIGQVYFYQDSKDGDVRVEVFAFGNENYLRSNQLYAMQVHEYGDITARDSTLIGGHYTNDDDDDDSVHGCPSDSGRHTGDLGNFFVSDHHQLVEGKTVGLITTYNSSDSIIGRSIALKRDEDPCTAGYVGSPIAFGTIGLARFAPNAVGIKVEDDAWLAAYITGSGACYRCEGKMWATQEASNTIRIIGKVSLPVGAPDAHQFVITQYGDITVKTGDLMGHHWQDKGQKHLLPDQLQGHNGDLGNNQWYVDYDDDDDFTTSWINLTISGRLSDVAGRGVQVYESYDRGVECKNGGGGRLFAFGVFGIANPDNKPPRALPPNIERVGALDDSFCSCGFLGVGFTSVVGVIVALFVAL